MFNESFDTGVFATKNGKENSSDFYRLFLHNNDKLTNPPLFSQKKQYFDVLTCWIIESRVLGGMAQSFWDLCFASKVLGFGIVLGF